MDRQTNNQTAMDKWTYLKMLMKKRERLERYKERESETAIAIGEKGRKVYLLFGTDNISRECQ